MSSIDYEKYLYELGLSCFRKQGMKYNSKCPRCDDILIKGSKGRLWFLPNDEHGYVAKCWNGNCEIEKGISLKNFLKLQNEQLYEQLRLEERSKYLDSIIDNKSIRPIQKKIEVIEEEKITYFIKKLNPKYFKPLTQECIDYCESRKIPKEIYSKFFWSEIKNKRWNNKLIMPMYRDSDNSIYAFIARHLRLKEFTRKPIKEGNITIANIFNVDKSKRVWVFESYIDSLTLKNTIAMNSADLPEEIAKQLPHKVYVYDNDQTGIDKSIIQLDKGFKVVLLPSTIEYKDANKMLTSGYSQEDIERIYLSNIYEGIVGKMKAYKLKKEKRF